MPYKETNDMWWRRLGFERNPYFGDELDVSDFSEKLFVGRESEIRSLLIDVSEDQRALVCIGGISGSGKTSFINHCQHVTYRNGEFEDFSLPNVMPCITKVQLHDGEDFSTVLLKILSSMIASILSFSQEKEIKPPQMVIELRDAIDSTVASGGGWGVGGAAFGFGANLNRDQNKSHNDSPLTREVSLIKMIESLVQIIVDTFRLDGVGVVIINIETLSEDYLLRIINYGRDSIFNMPHVWWYLSGPQNLGRMIETKAPRLRGFVSGTGIDIAPLSVVEVLKLLELRRNEYALVGDATLPVSDRIVELLYSASSGDLRFLFNICANIVRLTVKEMPSVQLNEEIAIHAVAVLTRRNLSHYLETQATGQIVRECLIRNVEQISLKDFREFGYDSKEGFSKELDALVSEQLLWLDVDKTGKGVYSPRGYLQLGILSNLSEVL